jgi:phage gp29-like protein
MPEGSIYNKVFRILSWEYLRKHYLNHIFASRIENYGIHLKYRLRMLEGLNNP